MRHTAVLAIPFFFVALSGRAADTPPAKPYEDAVKQLDAFIQHEVEAKNLPALSIALVDDQKIVWARGYGFADPQAKKPATADTVYRVGSVSKLFTDLAVMQLVERGALDLDAPITRVLPDFKPVNPFDTPITLRQLMCHRAGLVREPPIGNYFDPDEPSLDRTVKSLNGTELVYAPETHLKYSNAAVAVVGQVLEQTQNQAYPRYVYRAILDPLGMNHSSLEPDPSVTKDLAKAAMWSYDGRVFPAPTFTLGENPAGGLFTTVNDLSRFLSMLFAGGKAGDNVLVKPETLEQMWKPQYAKNPGDDRSFGIGFVVGQLDGRRRVGHGGAVYGFATEMDALPDDKLGVVVVASRDGANGVTSHIADVVLRQMLAVKGNKPAPKIEETTALKPEDARQLNGKYKSGDKTLELTERNGRLYALAGAGGFRVELRALGDGLVVDDRLAYGQKYERDGGWGGVTPPQLNVNGDAYEKIATVKPAPAPEKLAGLIGEYGWDHNTLFIFEKDGKLWALIEWFFFYPLEEEKPDVYKFPQYGLYLGEKIVFTRGKDGRATRAETAGVPFERRPIQGEDGKTFQIKPVRPLDEVRKAIAGAKPPEEKGEFRKTELVELTKLDDAIKLDLRYATDDNFLGAPLYTSARAFMQKPAAEALVRVNKKLAEKGLGLMVFDAYRPWSVTKLFWEATPEKDHIFVADPSKGSRHNRGCAVDLTLYDRKTGKPLEMTGGFDEMTDRSYPDYSGGTSIQRWDRDLLRRAMEAEGFTVYEWEWWHFDYKDWQKYPIGTPTFEEIAAGKQ
ncbi:MAG TPA: serine hydrolase [Gemmataceae bacterium]|nr:serine hydrolase [Gemmataceae bacterium]